MMLRHDPPWHRRHKTGFTLIELLVVVAVIAVVAAILFPIFAKARDTAKIAMCQSNLRQIAQAILMYVDDYNGFYPIGPITDTNGKTIAGWWEGQCVGGQRGQLPKEGVDARGDFYSPAQYRPLYKYTRKSPKLFRCPAERKQWCNNNFRNHFVWDVFGSSYELNGAFAYPTDNDRFYQLFGQGTMASIPKRTRHTSEVRNTKRMILMAERQLHYYWGRPVGATTAGGVYTTYPPIGHMYDHPVTPAAFCDGHVATIRMTAGLYGSNWAISQDNWGTTPVQRAAGDRN